jgi:hypothetical protein
MSEVSSTRNLDDSAMGLNLREGEEEIIENTPAEPTEAQAKDRYRQARRKLAGGVLRARLVSRGASGIASETAQHYWASVLFTRMAVTATSIQTLTPDLQPNAHWDFSAVASITRNLAECYLFFHFLCADAVPQVEKDARIILLNLHDHASRRKLRGELGEPEDVSKAAASAAVQDDLVRRFKANAYLSGLPEKRQAELIRGERTPFVQDDMIVRANMDKTNFRFLYRFFSNHTHTGPIAFYRMREHGRGGGFQNHADILYMGFALDFALDLMERATADFLVFFPDAETRGVAMRAAEAKSRPASGRKKRRRKGR